jgi:hypothetical protein
VFDITGATSQKYEANVDDIGFILAAKYTPVREDGLVGEPVTAQTTPIAIGKFVRPLHAVFRFSQIVASQLFRCECG